MTLTLTVRGYAYDEVGLRGCRRCRGLTLRVGLKRGVGSSVVLAVEEVWEGGVTSGVAGPGPLTCPLARQSAVVRLDLAVGLRPLGPVHLCRVRLLARAAVYSSDR
jgi:hypothetical protein